jgi:hypothetical protein
MAGELQIAMFCTPQRMDAEIRAAVHSGGYARGCRRVVDHALRSAFEPEARTMLPSRNDEPLGSPVTSSHHGYLCVHLGVALSDRCAGSG